MHLIVNFVVRFEVTCDTSHRRPVGEMCRADMMLLSVCDQFCRESVGSDEFLESHERSGERVKKRIVSYLKSSHIRALFFD